MLTIVSQAICVAYLLKGQDPCNYEEQNEIQYEQQIVEEFIGHIESKGKFKYALGCYGQKGCKGKYDCSGLIYSFAYDNGLNIRKQNSTSAYEMFGSKSIWDAKRGDLVYFERVSGDKPNHLAIVSTGYNGNGLEIIDALKSKAETRTIKLGNHKTYSFPGMVYRIHIIKNGYIQQYIKEKPVKSVVEAVKEVLVI